MKKSWNVLVADRESYDTLSEIPSVLRRAGCVVDVLCQKNSWLRRNCFCSSWIHAEKNPEKYADQLTGLARSKKYDWIILGDDATITLMNEKVGSDPQLFSRILPLSNIDHREMLGSKIGLAVLAERFHIDTPETTICTRDTAIKDSEYMNYPVVIKTDQGHSGIGVTKCCNKNELEKTLDNIGEDKRFLIQKYIDGDIVNTESLFKNGRLVAYAYSTTMETIRGEFGVSSSRAYRTCSTIEPILKRIGSSISINGFVNMTFMCDAATGKHLLIEADPRPQAWVSLARYAGVDFSKGVQYFLEDTKQIVRPPLYVNGESIHVWNFTRDIMRCILERDWQGILDWIENKDGRLKIVPWNDPLLLFWQFGRIVRFFLRSL